MELFTFTVLYSSIFVDLHTFLHTYILSYVVCIHGFISTVNVHIHI